MLLLFHDVLWKASEDRLVVEVQRDTELTAMSRYFSIMKRELIVPRRYSY